MERVTIYTHIGNRNSFQGGMKGDCIVLAVQLLCVGVRYLVQIEETNAINSRREAPIYPASFGMAIIISVERATNKVAINSESNLFDILVSFCVGLNCLSL